MQVVLLARRPLGGRRIALTYGYAPARTLTVVMDAASVPRGAEARLAAYVQDLAATVRKNGTDILDTSQGPTPVSE